MGRPSKGWKLRKRDGRPYSVAWTLDGERTELGLGTHDRGAAERAAREAYALAVQGVIKRQRAQKRARTGSAPTAEVGREWLADSAGTLAASTRELYAGHIVTLAAAFPSLLDVDSDTVEEYQRARLKEVLAVTVRKELNTLRGLLRWAKAKGKIGIVPEVRSIPKARGTNYAQPRRVAADELSPEEIDALLRALPEWTRSRRYPKAPPFPVRARFVVGYETGLRPAFLDTLAVPRNYTRGQTYLRIFDADDKTGEGRVVPITPRARRALDSVAPKDGLIFGKHDLREQIWQAAVLALGEDKAERFCGAHLRSARITHLLERTDNIMGVMRLVGHRQLATTSRYKRASDRAALAVIEAISFADK